MTNYNFSTLNDKEFEQIAKDLLNAKFNLGLQSFRVGKDKGIDLRFSTQKNNNSIVVQAKHYIGSAFSHLKHTLLKKELNKIQILNPDRYIIVTSLSLSATQKDEIKEILSPFVLNSNDVIGQDDLNEYLSSFEDIEKRYFKLWFSSVNVFNAIMNNAVESRTRSFLRGIEEKIKFYVVTKKLDDANRILQKEKLLLITGQPGIGKTTLAEIILFERAKNGYKIYKVENVTEAEDVASPSDDEKQLFYFDDFLGANSFEIMNAHRTETQLTTFVNRIRNAPNKYLILTTRTVILNHAIDNYEKISRSQFSSKQFEIKLTDYSNYEKALILYNHIYFNGVREDLHNSILNEKFYKKIITHKNYTPRIIEFITDESKINGLNSITYIQFILNNLNNPKEIWMISFNKQITPLDRCLLLTLFTFSSPVLESSFFTAFENRLEYEKNKNNQTINTNQFEESIKILLNGFISSRLYDSQPPVREYTFINPSLADFLIGYVSEYYSERKGIISSLTYIEQLKRFNPEKSLIPLEKELQSIVLDKVSSSKIQIQESSSKHFTKDEEYAILMEALCRYCNQVNIDTVLLDHFKKISFTEDWVNFSQKIEYVLLNLKDSPQTYKFIKENFKSIIEKMMDTISDEDRVKTIRVLFEKYEQDYDEYSQTQEGLQNLIGVIGNVLQSHEEDIKKDKKDEVKDLDEVAEYYEEIHSLENELKVELLPYEYLNYDFGIKIDDFYWEDKIEENLSKEEMDLNYDKEYYREMKFEIMTEEDAIDDLFCRKD